MSIQKVNTEAIAAAASAIASANANINSSFDELRNAGSDMAGSWNSRAGSAAETTLYQLFKGNEARSAVMQNYLNILQQVVNPGYESGETENTKLADQFL